VSVRRRDIEVLRLRALCSAADGNQEADILGFSGDLGDDRPILFNKDGPSVKGLVISLAADSSLRFSYASPSNPVGENACSAFTLGVTEAPDAFLPLLDIVLLSWASRANFLVDSSIALVKSLSSMNDPVEMAKPLVET
jgi:hypothetical protein